MTSLTFAELARLILTRSSAHPVRLVAVDGGAGSGKTTFAELLARSLGGAPIIPMDDFASWTDLTAYVPRFEAQVLTPLFLEQRVRYQQRDWVNDWAGDSLGPWREVPFERAVILEGIGSARREFATRLGYAIWIETPPAVRLRRGLARDGDDPETRALWERSMLGQRHFHAADGAYERADLVVDGERPLDVLGSRFSVLREGPLA